MVLSQRCLNICMAVLYAFSTTLLVSKVINFDFNNRLIYYRFVKNDNIS